MGARQGKASDAFGCLRVKARCVGADPTTLARETLALSRCIPLVEGQVRAQRP